MTPGTQGDSTAPVTFSHRRTCSSSGLSINSPRVRIRRRWPARAPAHYRDGSSDEQGRRQIRPGFRLPGSGLLKQNLDFFGGQSEVIRLYDIGMAANSEIQTGAGAGCGATAEVNGEQHCDSLWWQLLSCRNLATASGHSLGGRLPQQPPPEPLRSSLPAAVAGAASRRGRCHCEWSRPVVRLAVVALTRRSSTRGGAAAGLTVKKSLPHVSL